VRDGSLKRLEKTTVVGEAEPGKGSALDAMTSHAVIPTRGKTLQNSREGKGSNDIGVKQELERQSRSSDLIGEKGRKSGPTTAGQWW